VVGDAILDGPLHAAGVYLFAVADFFGAGGVAHFQILQRVAVDHDQVRREAGAYGGDAAGEPDVELVFERLRFAAALFLQMGVGVDQAGQDYLPVASITASACAAGREPRPLATGSSGITSVITLF
jgi:hypothetical protein